MTVLIAEAERNAGGAGNAGSERSRPVQPGLLVGQGPPYAVLAALVVSLRAELADARGVLEATRAELSAARGRIAELEARLRQTPRNSSRPPSSEGPGKPPPRPRSLRKKSGRKPGGQDGHEGRTLAQAARPDREVRHEPGCCGRCGAGLAGRPVTGVERRQVFDLPLAEVMVTEHQLIERECGCGHRTRAAAPRGAAASGLSPAPASSAQYAATCQPPPSTAPASSKPSSCSPKANPGCLPSPYHHTAIQPPDQLRIGLIIRPPVGKQRWTVFFYGNGLPPPSRTPAAMPAQYEDAQPDKKDYRYLIHTLTRHRAAVRSSEPGDGQPVAVVAD